MRLHLISTVLSFVLGACTNSGNEAYRASITKERALKNQEFLERGSPFGEAAQQSFAGLKYFAVDEKYRVEAKVNPLRKPQTVVLNQGDTVKKMMKIAKVNFKLENKEHSLLMYKSLPTDFGQNIDSTKLFFIPFFDESNSSNTYEGGRYIYPNYGGGNSVILDFNKAHNPYCAYDHKWNCVMPPPENTLSIEINAGEKRYE